MGTVFLYSKLQDKYCNLCHGIITTPESSHMKGLEGLLQILTCIVTKIRGYCSAHSVIFFNAPLCRLQYSWHSSKRIVGL